MITEETMSKLAEQFLKMMEFNNELLKENLRLMEQVKKLSVNPNEM